MTDRARTAAVAGALITAGVVAAALGSFALLSTALCTATAQDLVPGGCVPVGLVPGYALAFPVALAVAGIAVLALGLTLYRRARAASALAVGGSPWREKGGLGVPSRPASSPNPQDGASRSREGPPAPRAGSVRTSE